MIDITLWRMILTAVLITVIYNGIFLLAFGRGSECRYLYSHLKKGIR